MHCAKVVPAVLLSVFVVAACDRQQAQSGDGGSEARGGDYGALPGEASASPQTACDGTFSNGTVVQPTEAVWLSDVPADQTFCDFHTFSWNQFSYLVADGVAGPRFMELAPWYNLFVQAGSRPGPYPGDTSLQVHQLNKYQAGPPRELIDVDGQTALYDIRVNEDLYGFIAGTGPGAPATGLYTAAGYDRACGSNGTSCTKNIWVPPLDATGTGGSSLEVKTAWRVFESVAACPAASMYCEANLGLVGFHLIQKTKTHGEWIWSSFEHLDNAPDCRPGHSNPIDSTGPTGAAWSFFDPKTAPPEVMSTKTCEVPSQCNSNPSDGSGGFKQVNICRTDPIAAGGAGAANCKVVLGDPTVPNSPTNDAANNPGNVACLNASLAPQLSAPWSNYELIGTLWIRGETGPTELFRASTQSPPCNPGDGDCKEAVGFPHLANATLETWFQKGMVGTNGPDGCFGCHNLATRGPADSNPVADLMHLFQKIQKGPATTLVSTLE